MDDGQGALNGRQPIDILLDEPEALRRDFRAGRWDFEAGLTLRAAHALVRGERLAGAVLDRGGRVLAADPLFEALGLAGAAPEALDRALESRLAQIAWIENPDGAHKAAVAFAPLDIGRDWALPPEARQGFLNPRAAVVALGVATADTGQALEAACRAYGLTDLQTRIAKGLVRTGDVRGAAAFAQVTYETGRSVVAEVMRRTGAPRLPGVIERLVRLSLGVWPSGRDGTAALREVWGLSPRQATIALRIAEGLTRAEAAKSAGLSEALVKKELDRVFATLGVRTASQLARVMTETLALSLLTEATHRDVHVSGGEPEPLGLIQASDGRQLAYSDHGPRAGRPVLIVHSSSASRPAPTALVRTLQAAGFRPLTLDRPGFGLTEPVGDRRSDPFQAAVHDALALFDRLGLDRVDLIGRGGAQAVLALARAAPERIGRVVLVNPDPPTWEGGGRGPIRALKDAFLRRPELIEPIAHLIVASLSDGRVEKLMRKAIEGSPPDEAFMADPANVADYARGYRLFLTGRVGGYVSEQTALTRWSADPHAGAADWRVLIGEHDTMHEPEKVLAYWRHVLPGARFDLVPNAGRFLAMSRPQVVVDALKG